MPTFLPIALACSLLAGLAGFPMARGRDAAVDGFLRGRVTSKAGVPLAGVRVRVAVPAADQRLIDPTSDHPVREARTDAEGIYLVDLPSLDGPTMVSIDAMAPGFGRLSGTFMAGGDARRVEVKPGATVESDLTLEPARYYAGVVVDEQGRPIPGVDVGANLAIDRGSVGIERTASGPDGAFELFNYAVELPKFNDQPSRGYVGFSHLDYIEARIDDIDKIEPDRRGDLRVVLPTGRRVAGTVLDAGGKPVPGAMVEVELLIGGHRKATLTDPDGRFRLKGLSPGASALLATAFPIRQKARLALLNPQGDKDDVEVRLGSINLPADLASTAVLGMKLTDVTPGVKAAYEVPYARGAVVLDPGPDAGRLGIGPIAEGNCFWMVGDQRVGSVREFVDRILAEVGDREAAVHSVRVVYGFRSVAFTGTNTQYLKLTKGDIEALRAASAGLAATKP